MNTLLEVIAKRAEYYGLDHVMSEDRESNTQLTVTAPAGSMWWATLTENDDVLTAAFYTMNDEMEVVPAFSDDELDEKHVLESVKNVENIFQNMVPFINVDELPNRSDVKALWTGTGLWLLIDQIQACEDHLHILSKGGWVLTVPTGVGVHFPYKNRT